MMDVFVLVKETQLSVMKEVIREMSFFIKDSVFFTDHSEFYVAMNDSKYKVPDFVIMDYSFFQPELLSPWDEIKQSVKVCPVCVYNDPYPSDEDRVFYWIAKNRYFLTDLLTSEKIDLVIPAFKLIGSILLKPQINPCISIIAKPRKFNELGSIKEKLKDFFPYAEFPKSRVKLLDYFFEKVGQSVSKNELCRFMWNRSDDSAFKNLYTYIYDLRKLLSEFNEWANFNEGKLSLENDHDTYRLVYSG